MIDNCAKGKELNIKIKYINQLLHKKRTNAEFRFSAYVIDYDIENVMLDLGSDINVLPKQTWERMGRPNILWSSVQ
jgi:hypothetical protein